MIFVQWIDSCRSIQSENQPTYREKISFLYSGLKSKPSKKRRDLLAAFLLLGLAYFSTLTIEAIFSSETSVHFLYTTRGYITQDRNLRSHRCENLQSYKLNCIFHMCAPVPNRNPALLFRRSDDNTFSVPEFRAKNEHLSFILLKVNVFLLFSLFLSCVFLCERVISSSGVTLLKYAEKFYSCCCNG
jgi:hypothetical protein